MTRCLDELFREIARHSKVIMEALLPSEVARLVLGYLEDQQCTEAAKQFLESSPHLLECRTVASHGKRFSTKVNGLRLTDIIEKFCAISAMIQERLNKATDCEQLKYCGYDHVTITRETRKGYFLNAYRRTITVPIVHHFTNVILDVLEQRTPHLNRPITIKDQDTKSAQYESYQVRNIYKCSHIQS